MPRRKLNICRVNIRRLISASICQVIMTGRVSRCLIAVKGLRPICVSRGVVSSVMVVFMQTTIRNTLIVSIFYQADTVSQ